MRIGIVSMQKVINYGSFLQAYALRKTIESLGHEAYFVDIKKGIQIELPEKPSVSEHRFKLSELPKRVEHVQYVKKRREFFYKRLFNEYGINDPKDESELDFLVVGSDEVFNCLQRSSWGLSLQLLGDTAVPAVSYAASCGYTTLEGLYKAGVVSEIANSLKKFKAISVRDGNTAKMVREVSGIEPQIHLDPVLIYDWTMEIEETVCFKDYILVYGYDNRINREDEIAAIKRFAKKHRKKLLSFGVYQRWCDKNILCHPFQLISYFKHADYIVTDTFHGTVLSIKCGKQFATIIRESNKNKITDLLSKFNLEGRAVEISRIGDILETPIDYTRVNDIIAREREKTIEYLEKNIRL
jgi:hypothetical protein